MHVRHYAPNPPFGAVFRAQLTDERASARVFRSACLSSYLVHARKPTEPHHSYRAGFSGDQIVMWTPAVHTTNAFCCCFLLALLAALEAVVVGFWFRGGNVFMTVGEPGAFSRFWLALSVFAALGLVVYILATSERFHRNAVPKCPRCEVSVRNLDDSSWRRLSLP